VSLARRQKERYRKTLTVGPGMDFGRKATARAAKSLVLSPPLAPAAQWCARMTVLSTICTASLPPPAASATLRPKRDRTPEPLGPGGGGYDPSKRRGGPKQRRGP